MEELRITIEGLEETKKFIDWHINDLEDMINKNYVTAEYTGDYQAEIRECNGEIRKINQKIETLKAALEILEEGN